MVHERKKHIEALFHAASEIDATGERQRFLNEACAEDKSLRAELDALLESAEAGEGIFRCSEVAIASRSSNSTYAQIEALGSTIGRYKLLEKIAEGGMGVVYMAEQQHPVRRKVALKIIKLGMDTRQVIARFEAERQALAMMDHPNIAQVLDAGATDTGRPYFVMELVNGVPITQFCRENHLSLEERLKLFIPVCQAIQSAHQKGIIHRDIKPSNVLVTRSSPGTAGHPMVIDFGVAKAIDQKLTEKTLFTNFATMIGTPAYMSPEQAEMSKLDVDTRSDIYSLGVLLYELLAGSPPFLEGRLRSVAYGEMQRIIVEEDPERPSTRLSKSSRSQAELRELNQEIDPDLDAIVLKSLEKDRARRYGTASGFAADLQRFLEGEPVKARPPSTAYRLQKWVARHKLQCSSAVIVILTLVAAVIVSSAQAARARRSEADAMQQARRAELQARIATSERERANREAALAKTQTEAAEAVKQFLIDNLLGVNSLMGTPDLDAAAYKATEALLEKTARSIEGRFTNQPSIEADLRKALYQGFGAVRNLPQALIHAERLLQIYQGLPDLPRTNIFVAASWIATSKAAIGQTDDALKLLEQYLQEAQRIPGGQVVESSYGIVLLIAQRPHDAVPHLRTGLARAKTLFGENHISVKQNTGVLATALEETGDAKGAESLWRQNLENSIQDLPAEHPFTLTQELYVGRNLVRQGKSDAALQILKRVAEQLERATGTNSFVLLECQYFIGEALEQKKEIAQAAELYRHLHHRLVQKLPHYSAFYRCKDITEFFVRHRLYTEAKSLMAGLHQWYEANPPNNSERFEHFVSATAAVRGWPAAATLYEKQTDSPGGSLFFLLKKAWLFRFVGREEEYQQVVSEALSQDLASIPLHDRHLPIEIAALGRVDFSDAQREALKRQMTALEGLLPTRNTDSRFWGSRALAQMQFRLGNFSDALRTLEAVNDQVEKDSYALVIKAACLSGLGESEKARELFANATALSDQQLPQPLAEAEPFLSVDQLYQHLVMRRETGALLGSSAGAAK